MDEEEDNIDLNFYRQLETAIFDNFSGGIPSIPTSSETITDEEDHYSYVCTCPWMFDQQAMPEEDVVLPPSPSDLLYDQLANQNYVCKGSDASSSTDSRLTPDSDIEPKNHMVPFTIRWSLGFTVASSLVNFTKQNRKEFYIATAHKGNIYDYEHNTMRYVHGHIKPVRAASVDDSGQWLVTAGHGHCSKIIITDTIKCKQLLILNNDPEDMGAYQLGMAPDARFFISVHCIESPIIKVWLWTHGNVSPDYEYHVGKNIGKPCRIVFHPNDQSFIMIAFEKQIIYTHWNEDNNTLDQTYSPDQKKLGVITDCTMALNRHETYASTANGYLVIFGNMLYTESFGEHDLNNKKIYVKKIKVCRSAIKTLSCLDNVLVTLEEKGTLKFFDTDILLLYWIEKDMPPIIAVTFSLQSIIAPCKEKMKMKIAHPAIHFNLEIEEEEEDRVLEYESLLTKTVRSKASLHHRPFIIRDFIAGCHDGRIFHVDLVNDTFKAFFYIADSPVASLCVSTVRSYLYVAYENGRVTIFDYEQLECVITTTVLSKKSKRKRNPDEEDIIISSSYIQVSELDVHLVVARTNGAIIFLGPTLLPIPSQHYQHTNFNIERMAFSANNNFLAFYDTAKTMFVLQYNEENWGLLMKFRGHHEPITDMLFLHYEEPRLYTIGADRHMVEYNLDISEDLLKNRVKIEETAIPLCFIYYETPPNYDNYFLVANSEYKFKMIHEQTMICKSVIVGPHLGCYDTPVNKLTMLPNSHGKYIIFANDNHMGIVKTPPDGNPYKHIGALANPHLGGVALCNQGNYVFTHARNEGGILVWTINTNSVDILHYLGGTELAPYASLLEGGENGWYFKEIEDLFCYMQILHQEDAYSPQKFSDSIFITDVPDLVRACGFYPSDYETNLLLYDIEYRDYEHTGKTRTKISFVEFVKLFINHRPAYGISLDKIQESFERVFEGMDEVKPKEFSAALCKYGEPFTADSLAICIDNLMAPEENEDQPIFEKLESISYEYFTESMLGLLGRTSRVEDHLPIIRESDEDEDDN